MPNGETTINELMEFLQENMFTKADGEILEQKVNRLEQKVDRLEQKVESNHLELSGQIRMIENELADIKQRLIRLEKRTIEDADASAGDYLKLQKRLETAEEEIKIVKNQIRQLQAV
jgi:DNA helicase IV